MDKPDMFHNPPHYCQYPVQPIEITRHLSFCLGNAVKYILRAPFKGKADDCQKAIVYLGWQAQNGKEKLDIFIWRKLVSGAYGYISHLSSAIDNETDASQRRILNLQRQFIREFLVYIEAEQTDCQKMTLVATKLASLFEKIAEAKSNADSN